MTVSLEERLKALDEAREKIIHESFLEEQQKLEDELRKEYKKLQLNAAGDTDEN